MNKSKERNVYALRGTPFVLVAGHRLYARENTLGIHGRKAVCSAPVKTRDGITVKVALDADHGQVIETWGGKFGSDYIEKPSAGGKVAPAPTPQHTGYLLIHPTVGRV